MKILLTAINAKYIHSNPAVYSLAAYANGNLSEEEKEKCQVEIAEYFPKENVTRDITVSDKVNCIPGHEEAFEEGKQKFFKKAQLFYKCVTRVRELDMDFFVRNETCYYVRDREQRKGREYEK